VPKDQQKTATVAVADTGSGVQIIVVTTRQVLAEAGLTDS
jgi:hypothetical protein